MSFNDLIKKMIAYFSTFSYSSLNENQLLWGSSFTSLFDIVSDVKLDKFPTSLGSIVILLSCKQRVSNIERL